MYGLTNIIYLIIGSVMPSIYLSTNYITAEGSFSESVILKTVIRNVDVGIKGPGV
jgi:hypothetical protein